MSHAAQGWGDIVSIPFHIPAKPRQKIGLTMVIDKGLGPTAFNDLLIMGSPFIDFIKLGFGTSLLYPPQVLCQKIALARRHEVEVYPGGTLLEMAELQGVSEQFLDRVCEQGVRMVEVSEGTIPLSTQRRQQLIQSAKSRGLRVVSEVGKKQKGIPLDPHYLRMQVEKDREAGSEWVIVEGRDSGKGVGVYDHEGRVDENLVDEIVANLTDPSVLIWEAPQVAQQQYLIMKFGTEVNLGNIQAEDVITLAATRAGVRGDTFRLVVEQQLALSEGV